MVAEDLLSGDDLLWMIDGYLRGFESIADNVKISAKLTKKYPSNWELSASRAIAVVKLLETNGVDPQDPLRVGFQRIPTGC